MTDIFLYKELTRTKDIMNENFQTLAGGIRGLALGMIIAGIGFIASAKIEEEQDKKIAHLNKDLHDTQCMMWDLKDQVKKLSAKLEEKENTECD